MGYALTLAPMIQLLASGGGGEAQPGIADPLLSHWLWTWIIFGFVFLVLYKFAFKPIREQLEARENRIRETIDKAHRVKAESEALLDKHRELMDRAKADAQEIINQGRDAAITAKDAIVQSGQDEARASVERARREIDLETKKALDEIRRETVDLTIMAASQVLGRSLEDDDHRRLTSEVIAEMGSAKEG